MAKIIEATFSVGKAHPLYGKRVKAEVIQENCGFDGKQIYARTVEDVLFTNRHANVFKDGRFIGERKLPDIHEKWEGYIEI